MSTKVPSPSVARRPRSPIRVPILAIVLIVATFAIAFTALRTASKLWHETTYTFTVLVLLTAVLASRFRRGPERAFWFGFAVFGWAFFLLGYRPWMNAFGEITEDGEGSPFNPLLLTSRLLVYLLPRVRLPTNDGVMLDPITATTLAILHLLVTLAVALLGGVIALLLRRHPRGRPSAKAVSILVGLALAGSVAISVSSAEPLSRREMAIWAWQRHDRLALAMGEPSLQALSEDDPEATAYRLFWLPSFHHPVCVRIERVGDRARLRVAMLDGHGPHGSGFIAVDQWRSLSGEQWDRLERLLTEAAFWESSSWSVPRAPDVQMCDGDYLTFERVRGGSYHVISTWDPVPPCEIPCRYMLDLTGIDLGRVWEGYHSAPSSGEPE